MKATSKTSTTLVPMPWGCFRLIDFAWFSNLTRHKSEGKWASQDLQFYVQMQVLAKPSCSMSALILKNIIHITTYKALKESDPFMQECTFRYLSAEHGRVPCDRRIHLPAEMVHDSSNFPRIDQIVSKPYTERFLQRFECTKEKV